VENRGAAKIQPLIASFRFGAPPAKRRQNPTATDTDFRRMVSSMKGM